jgi:hypothetical protein
VKILFVMQKIHEWNVNMIFKYCSTDILLYKLHLDQRWTILVIRLTTISKTVIIQFSPRDAFNNSHFLQIKIPTLTFTLYIPDNGGYNTAYASDPHKLGREEW